VTKNKKIKILADWLKIEIITTDVDIEARSYYTFIWNPFKHSGDSKRLLNKLVKLKFQYDIQLRLNPKRYYFKMWNDKKQYVIFDAKNENIAISEACLRLIEDKGK
jgi:hypothetical protein